LAAEFCRVADCEFVAIRIQWCYSFDEYSNVDRQVSCIASLRLVSPSSHTPRVHAMENKSTVMFVVLALCGTACILASIGVVTYLYHEHAAQIEQDSANSEKFGLFVAFPSMAGFVVGAALVATGIWIGLKDKAR
jgi:hypothetical protein